MSKAWDLINVIGTEILRSIAEIMDREFEKKWSKKKLIFFFYRKLSKPGDLINVIGTEILRSIAEIMDREFEKNVQKKKFSFSIEKLSKAWGPHKCHRNRNPQVHC